MQQSEAKNRSTDKSVANLLSDFSRVAPDTNQPSVSGRHKARDELIEMIETPGPLEAM